MTTNTIEIQTIIGDYCEQLYCKKVHGLKEMDTLLEIYKFLRLNQEEIKKMNRMITSNEIESVIKQAVNKQKFRTR